MIFRETRLISEIIAGRCAYSSTPLVVEDSHRSTPGCVPYTPSMKIGASLFSHFLAISLLIRSLVPTQRSINSLLKSTKWTFRYSKRYRLTEPTGRSSMSGLQLASKQRTGLRTFLGTSPNSSLTGQEMSRAGTNHRSSLKNLAPP